MTVQYLADKFWRDGYLVLEDFFSDALMDDMQRMILDHYGKTPSFLHEEEFVEKSATEVVPWFPQQEGVQLFDKVEQNTRLRGVTEAILGEGWQALYCMTMFSAKGTKGQAWHQDCPPENRQHFNLNRLVYTMDIDNTTGGQVLVKPRSHRLGALTVGEVNVAFDDQVLLNPKKGTLVIIHGHTWHRVTPIAGEYRVSTNYRAMPQNTPEDITDICVYRNMRYRFSTQEVLEERG